jgi:hypothetical protein
VPPAARRLTLSTGEIAKELKRKRRKGKKEGKEKRKIKKKKRNELFVFKLLFINYVDQIILVNENRNSHKK